MKNGLLVASARQIEANRRNAGKSTGPRSRAGKKRSSRNAFRHGLSLSLIPSAALAKQIEELASKIAGSSKCEVILELARDAAYAQFEIARVHRTKTALINCVAVLGTLEPERAAPTFNIRHMLRYIRYLVRASRDVRRYCRMVAAGITPIATPDIMPPVIEKPIPLPAIPSQEPERAAEAVRRILPELIKLQRYECRAVARRDRAIRAIASQSRGER